MESVIKEVNIISEVHKSSPIIRLKRQKVQTGLFAVCLLIDDKGNIVHN